MTKRMDRIGSLLKEVIAEVIMKEVNNPDIGILVTIKQVTVSKDLQQAKVYVSLFGSENTKRKALKALKSASGFISVQAAKKVYLHRFPALTFYIDNTLDEEIRIHSLVERIQDERARRTEDDAYH